MKNFQIKGGEFALELKNEFNKENEISLCDRAGTIFFAKRGEELLAYPPYDTILNELLELSKTLKENRFYNVSIIDEILKK